MRRSIPDTLRRPPPDVSATEPLLSLSLPLRCITPVFGGGVEALAPDEIEAVRVPGLRGTLRQMWRLTCNPPPADLFQREAALFGGVGLGQGDQARRSPVVLSVTVDNPGKIEAAGRHSPKPNGGLRALPDWHSSLKPLSYALFPLQRSDEIRRNADPRYDLPTAPLRHGLRFTLHVQFHGRGGPHDQQRIDELLTALCALVHYGGVGGRQRRGFGALALQEGASVAGLPRLPGPWPERFAPPKQGAPWPRLQGAEVWIGPAVSNVQKVHGLLVDRLRQFRQEPGLGRAPGTGKPQGTSHWPEAQVLRALRLIDDPCRMDHAPSRELLALARRSFTDRQGQRHADRLGLPRAAFGLPIQVKFKDPGDGQADATLNPKTVDAGTVDATSGRDQGNRFPSPLWLRPLACQGGYAPMALAFPERPAAVVVAFKRRAQPVHIDRPFLWPFLWDKPGTVAERLAQVDGDAVQAFLRYLADTERLQRIGDR